MKSTITSSFAPPRSRLVTSAALADQHRLLAYQHLAANQLKRASSLLERGEHGPALSILDTLAPPQGLPDSRGFAWYYLDRLVRPRVTMLPPLPARVRAVAYALVDRTIALADETNKTFVMDLDTGTLRELPAKHKLKLCTRLVFSLDGRTLASLSHGDNFNERGKSEVKIWDVATGATLDGMAGDFGYCYQILFSPDGGTLVTLDAALSHPAAPVRSWRISDKRKRVTLDESLRVEELKARLSAASRPAGSARGSFRLSDVLAVTPEDASTISVSAESGEIWLYTTAGGYCKAVCRVQEPEVVFIPRTDLSVPYTQAEVDEIGHLACTLTGRGRARPIGQGSTVLWARFSRDGRTAAVHEPYPGHPDGRLRLIDVGTGRLGVESPWGDVWVGCTFEFAPDQDALLVVGRDTEARLWDFSRWRAPGALNGHSKEVWGLAFSPDGRTLVSTGDDHTLKMWNASSGLEEKTLKGHGSLVTAVAYSPDGELLAAADWDGKIRLWKTAEGALLATLEGHTDHVRAVAFSPDGKTLASAGDDRTIRSWNAATRRELRSPLTGHTGTVFTLLFAPHGKTLYSGAGDRTVRVWDWEEGRFRAAWRAEEEVYSLAVSPDAAILAMAQRKGRVRLWEVAQQKPGHLLQSHVDDVLGVAFSPDGLTLASAGRDHSVRLWDPVTGHELLTLNGHSAPVQAIAFSPDGMILATGSHDGAIKLWRASPKKTAAVTKLPKTLRTAWR